MGNRPSRQHTITEHDRTKPNRFRGDGRSPPRSLNQPPTRCLTPSPTRYTEYSNGGNFYIPSYYYGSRNTRRLSAGMPTYAASGLRSVPFARSHNSLISAYPGGERSSFSRSGSNRYSFRSGSFSNVRNGNRIQNANNPLPRQPSATQDNRFYFRQRRGSSNSRSSVVQSDYGLMSYADDQMGHGNQPNYGMTSTLQVQGREPLDEDDMKIFKRGDRYGNFQGGRISSGTFSHSASNMPTSGAQPGSSYINSFGELDLRSDPVTYSDQDRTRGPAFNVPGMRRSTGTNTTRASSEIDGRSVISAINAGPVNITNTNCTVNYYMTTPSTAFSEPSHGYHTLSHQTGSLSESTRF